MDAILPSGDPSRIDAEHFTIWQVKLFTSDCQAI
jgi:hypothetical protein